MGQDRDRDTMVRMVAQACCLGQENAGNCDGPVPLRCSSDCGVIFSEYWGQCSLDITAERRASMSDFMAKVCKCNPKSRASDS